MRVAVLALQGGFDAHAAAVEKLGHSAVLARDKAAIEGAEGLVLPGGESTTLLRLAEPELLMAIVAHARAGKPVLATCAGLILAARKVAPEQPSLGICDVQVARNAWGRQIASFQALADGDCRPLTFIRAPRIVETGPNVAILARYRGEPVLLREGAFVGATFHPELTADLGVHRLAFGQA